MSTYETGVIRTNSAISLLEHGPMSTREFVLATGWPPRVAHKTLYRLARDGVLVRTNRRGVQGYVYSLAKP